MHSTVGGNGNAHAINLNFELLNKSFVHHIECYIQCVNQCQWHAACMTAATVSVLYSLASPTVPIPEHVCIQNGAVTTAANHMKYKYQPLGCPDPITTSPPSSARATLQRTGSMSNSETRSPA